LQGFLRLWPPPQSLARQLPLELHPVLTGHRR
jgi:hypothetical protein